MGYESDRAWSDRFIPVIKGIVGPELLAESSFEVDTQQAADLIVFKARNITVAARVRRRGYADQYGHEFTIRCARDNGVKTELSKIIDGWGDWLFYGHEHPDTDGDIGRWLLVDLAAFRATMVRREILITGGRPIRMGRKKNGDGTSFAWFDWRSFPNYPPILVAESVIGSAFEQTREEEPEIPW